MFFKKAAGNIFDVQLSKAEQRALDAEIKKQIVEHDKQYDIDRESSILWMLHTEFDFGPKKLKRAWQLMYASGIKLREHYEMSSDDDGWLCRKMLKEMGCDVEQWYKDLDVT